MTRYGRHPPPRDGQDRPGRLAETHQTSRRDTDYTLAFKAQPVAVALHIDAASLQAPKQSPEGYLRVEGVIATPGILPYHRGGEVVREYVPESTLKDPEWLRSLEGKPVVIEHPPEELVDPNNVGRLEVGTVYDVRWVEGRGVVAKIILKDQAGITAFRKKGYTELSPAYEATTDQEAGSNQFGDYDLVQTKRRAANHVALTRNGRAGSKASIRTDSDEYGEPWVVRTDEDDDPVEDESTTTDPQEIRTMPRLNFDGLDIEVEDTHTAQVINEWQKRKDQEVEDLEGDLSEAKSKIQELKNKRDKIEAQLQAFRDALGVDDGQEVEGPEDVEDMMGKGEKGAGKSGAGGGQKGGQKGGMKPDDEDDEQNRTDSRSFEELYQERRKLEQAALQLNLDELDEEITQDEFKRTVINEFFDDDRADSMEGDILDVTFQTVDEILEDRRDARDESLEGAEEQIRRRDSRGGSGSSGDGSKSDYASRVYD